MGALPYATAVLPVAVVGMAHGRPSIPGRPAVVSYSLCLPPVGQDSSRRARPPPPARLPARRRGHSPSCPAIPAGEDPWDVHVSRSRRSGAWRRWRSAGTDPEPAGRELGPRRTLWTGVAGGGGCPVRRRRHLRGHQLPPHPGLVPGPALRGGVGADARHPPTDGDGWRPAGARTPGARLPGGVGGPQRAFAELIDDTEAFPHAADLVRACHGLGLRTVLATSSPADELAHHRRVLDADDALDATTGSDDVDASKPSPDVFLGAMEAGGLDPARSLAVGDSVWDIRAADAAGIGLRRARVGRIQSPRARPRPEPPPSTGTPAHLLSPTPHQPPRVVAPVIGCRFR